MTNDMTFAILVVAAAAALIVYLDMEVSSAVERKHDEILSRLSGDPLQADAAGECRHGDP